MRKVILITGASSGIGKETAKLLTKKGFIIYGLARRLEKMQDLKDSGVKIIKMDLTLDSSMTEGINEILKNEGRIDVLVNNAGYGTYGSLEDVPISEAKNQYEVNVFGLARLIQLVLPQMRKQGSGKIINISSMGGKIGMPHGSWYHSTKFALEGLSDSLRMELKQFGIKVVIIEPGAIMTEWDEIASKNLLKFSGNTVYGNLAKKHVKMLENFYKNASKPLVVAETILKAIISRNPKTRYAVGLDAKLLILLKAVLPDKIFDKIFLKQLK